MTAPRGHNQPFAAVARGGSHSWTAIACPLRPNLLRCNATPCGYLREETMSELGTWLIRAREARGLTIEDAERDTRISRRYLQALESEQFEVIPAPVYARGFLRSYSQYLGLDPAEMLALFPRDDQPPAQHSAQHSVIGGNRRPQSAAPQRQAPQSSQQTRPQQPP